MNSVYRMAESILRDIEEGRYADQKRYGRKSKSELEAESFDSMSPRDKKKELERLPLRNMTIQSVQANGASTWVVIPLQSTDPLDFAQNLQAALKARFGAGVFDVRVDEDGSAYVSRVKSGSAPKRTKKTKTGRSTGIREAAWTSGGSRPPEQNKAILAKRHAEYLKHLSALKKRADKLKAIPAPSGGDLSEMEGMIGDIKGLLSPDHGSSWGRGRGN